MAINPKILEDRKRAEERIKLVKIDLRKEQDTIADDRGIPNWLVWMRSAYTVMIDGEARAYLTFEGGWNRSGWYIYPLDYSGSQSLQKRFPLYFRNIASDRGKLARWLFETYKAGENYPTLAEIAEAKRKEDEETAAMKQRMKEAEDRRRREAREEKAAARDALNELRGIRGHVLTSPQMKAVNFAIDKLQEIADRGNGQ